jgi:hypothetical protein
MRNEREMFDLILHVAKGDERVRGAWLNGYSDHFPTIIFLHKARK